MDNLGIPRGIGQADPVEIDQIGILKATFLAMERALEDLERKTDWVAAELLVDGNQDPHLGRPTRCIVGGDGKETCIAAASIVAKEYRDGVMTRLGERFPGFGFERNSGYPTKEHLAGLQAHGATPEHRLVLHLFAERWSLDAITEVGKRRTGPSPIQLSGLEPGPQLAWSSGGVGSRVS